jgi:hypothetical protein
MFIRRSLITKIDTRLIWSGPVMIARGLSPITPVTSPQLFPTACEPGQANVPVSVILLLSRRVAARPENRTLIRPEPGFYVMRLRSGAPVVPAIIYQLCPMVIPEPTNVAGPHPVEWCRPLDRSPRYEARIDGKRVDIDRVWTSRSLRSVSGAEFEFRSGPLRRWAREHPSAPEARPDRPVDLNAIPPLF